MIILTYKLSIFILLFVQSVISADIYESKSVERRNLNLDQRKYNLNHPPFAEDKDTNPVSTINEDDEIHEEIDARSTIEETPKNTELTSTYPEKHEPDIEKEELKPKARSLNFDLTTKSNKEENDQTQTSKKPYSSTNIETKISRRPQRRRLTQVRKVEVNNSATQHLVVTTTKSPQIERYLESNGKISIDSPHQQSSRNIIPKRTRMREPVVPIIDSENYVYSHRGNYHYSYEGGDGTKAFERGQLKSSDGGTGEAVEGSFSYTDQDGNDFSLSYTADENGYRPVGAHLPTPPPIPPAIQRALDLLATKTTPEPVTERVKKLKL